MQPDYHITTTSNTLPKHHIKYPTEPPHRIPYQMITSNNLHCILLAEENLTWDSIIHDWVTNTCTSQDCLTLPQHGSFITIKILMHGATIFYSFLNLFQHTNRSWCLLITCNKVVINKNNLLLRFNSFSWNLTIELIWHSNIHNPTALCCQLLDNQRNSAWIIKHTIALNTKLRSSYILLCSS